VTGQPKPGRAVRHNYRGQSETEQPRPHSSRSKYADVETTSSVDCAEKWVPNSTMAQALPGPSIFVAGARFELATFGL